MSEWDEPLTKACNNIIAKHHLKVEKLTGDQLAEAIRQAIISGDFVRNVYVTGGLESAQAVTYIPGREIASLRRKISELKTENEDFRKRIQEAHAILS